MRAETPPPRPASRPAEPTIAAIVPATDRPATVARCTAALMRGDRPPDELIVQREPPGSGPAAARNAAARRASADLLVFVDSDVEVHGDALARIASRFAAEPRLTALFGAYDDRPEAPGAVSRFRNLLHHHVHAEAAGEASTFWAGLGAVRRDAFLRAGGFDAGRFPEPSVEDVELGMRMADEGAAIALDPTIRGRHLKRWSLASMVRTDFSRRGVPWVRLLLERGGSSSALNLGWRHRLSALAVVSFLLAALGRRRPAAAAAGLALLALNARFYLLLGSRGGAGLAVAGVGLHAVHHLTAAAALPAGAAAHLLGRGR